MADVRAGTETRYGFYGLGNTNDIDPDATKDTEPFLYRVERGLYAATVDLTRKIIGPLSASIMLNGAIADYSSLSPTSIFELTYGPELNQTEGSVTGALVLDLRNNEYDTRKGVLVEAGGQYGGSERNYSRWYGIARGWFPRPEEHRARRARLRHQHRRHPDAAVAGGRFRAGNHPTPRSVARTRTGPCPSADSPGSGFLGTNIEVRQDVFAKGEYGALGIVLFMDAGRSFQNDFKVTFDDWTVGGGGGLVLQDPAGQRLHPDLWHHEEREPRRVQDGLDVLIVTVGERGTAERSRSLVTLFSTSRIVVSPLSRAYQRRSSLTTSAFGSSGRVGHDPGLQLRGPRAPAARSRGTPRPG